MSEAPAQAWKLFVSYTGEDLAAHAAEVVQAAVAAGWLVEDHSFWPATGHPSVAACLAKVRECHALLLLSAHRKGWVPGEDAGGHDGKSICHLEWDAAAGRPRVGLLADPTAVWGGGADPPDDGLRAEVEATLRGSYFGEDAATVRPLAQAALAGLEQELASRWDVARKHDAARGVLRPPHRKLPAEYPPSYLLRAEFEVVEFHGRVAELDAFEAWCLSGPATGVRLVVGPGGTGKTRLAAELCARLHGHGWIAGFLERELDDDAVERVIAADLPALVVIDYAETRRAEVRRWLNRLGRGDRLNGDVRVLLVAREAGGWWEELRTEEAEYELLLHHDPARLAPLTLDPASRVELFGKALEGFAREVGTPDDPAAARLDADLFADALWVLLAARAALDGRTLDAADDLLRDQIDRESRFWRRSAKEAGLTLTADEQRRAVAAATLAGADSRDDAVALVERLPGFRDGRALPIVRWLRHQYPGDGWLGGLQPDLLGEALVARSAAADPDFVDDVVATAPDDQVLHALTMLTRSARFHDSSKLALGRLVARSEMALPAMRVAQETGDPIGVLLAEAVAAEAFDETTRSAMLGRLPRFTVALRELAYELLSRRVESLRSANDTSADGLGGLASSFQPGFVVLDIELPSWRRLYPRHEDRKNRRPRSRQTRDSHHSHLGQQL